MEDDGVLDLFFKLLKKLCHLCNLEMNDGFSVILTFDLIGFFLVCGEF